MQVCGEGHGQRGQQRADGGAAGRRRALQQKVQQQAQRVQRRRGGQRRQLRAQRLAQQAQRLLQYGQRSGVGQETPGVERAQHLQQQRGELVGGEHGQQLLARGEDARQQRQLSTAQQRGKTVAHKLLLRLHGALQLRHEQLADLLLRRGVVRGDAQEQRAPVLQQHVAAAAEHRGGLLLERRVGGQPADELVERLGELRAERQQHGVRAV